jgi:hypothetical protein
MILVVTLSPKKLLEIYFIRKEKECKRIFLIKFLLSSGWNLCYFGSLAFFSNYAFEIENIPGLVGLYVKLFSR